MADSLEFGDYSLVRTDEPSADSHRDNKLDNDGSDEDTLYFGGNDDGRAKLLPSSIDEDSGKSPPSVFSMEFFQQYFDVDTDQVLTRLVYSCWPNPKNSFIETHIRPTPDLYGPVWVCVTLVFAVGMCSNLADYIQSWLHGNHTHWHYDFHLVTLAATLVACYVLLAPAAIYSLLWYRRVPCRYTAFELLSAYGYSMAVFVPASLCLVVDLSPVRWLSLLAAAALSGLTLAMAIKPTLECPKALATFVLGFVLAAHSLFALFLGLAFSVSFVFLFRFFKMCFCPVLRWIELDTLQPCISSAAKVCI